MKVAIAGMIVALSLSGCIAVPVVEPAPVAGYYYHAPPPPTVYFGYSRGGGHRHHYRPYRHRHRR
jgi:hypothetical protein